MKIIYSILLLSIIATAQAQAPSWSVNSSTYQYDMTITAVIEVNCVELGNTANQIAVSSNGVVRGVAYTSSIGAGRYIAIISAYSNQVSGETLSIQLYDGVGDSIYVSIDSVLFQDNGIVGSPSNPLIFRTNNSPTAIQINSDSIVENFPIGSSVGNFSTSDLDVSQTHSYTLASGAGDTDNGLFSIANNQLLSGFVADYETRKNYTVRVRTTDSEGCFYEAIFPVAILDGNDMPTDIILTNNNVNENIPAGNFVGAIRSVDQDSSDFYNYSLVTGSGDADNSNFIIRNDSIFSAIVFNKVTQGQHSIRLQTDDQRGGVFSKSFTILIKDINNSPTQITLSNNVIGDNSMVFFKVGNFTSLDDDLGDIHTYSLTAGVNDDDNASFVISGTELRTNTSFDTRTKTLYKVRVLTDDGFGGTFQDTFRINIINDNAVPYDLLLSNNSLEENNTFGNVIGILQGLDSNALDTFKYELVAGAGDANNTSFSVNRNELITAEIFNFEVKTSYNIRLQVSDNKNTTFQKAFTITISDQNEKPTSTSQDYEIAENQGAESEIGLVVFSDVDNGEVFTYKVIEGSINFSIDENSGMLSAISPFDYESQIYFTAKVEVTDIGGLKDTAKVEVEIKDQVEGSLPVSEFISPNGDGMNDLWQIRNIELYSNYRLSIFSVNGLIVYDKPNNYNNDWNGTISGNPLDDGLYYYYLVNNEDNSINFKGTITLKK